MRSGLTVFARLALTCTAIAPVGFTYAAVAALTEHYGTMVILLAASVIMVRICIWVMDSIKTRTSVNPDASAPEQHKITNVEPADRENTAIILLYLMPLFTADLNDLNWIIWVPTILVFSVIVMTSHSYFFNPLLGLFGWHFYRVGTPENVTRLLISKQTINKGDRTIIGIQLSDYVILDTE